MIRHAAIIALIASGLICVHAQSTAGGAVIPNKGSAPLPSTAPLGISHRASCSSLCAKSKPAEEAFKIIAGMGFKYVDLSCLNWCRHASVPKLLADFDTEAARVEQLLATNGLKASNLTFDGINEGAFESYKKSFEVVVRMAARLKARVVNIMAPSAKTDRNQAAIWLKQLQSIAAKEGVLFTIETHVGQITERPSEALWLCQQVPGLGLTLDPSHYYAGPNQGASFDALYPYVQGTGLRAGGMNVKELQLAWGQGPIDFSAVVRKLEAAGYKGCYVTEYLEGLGTVNAVAEATRFLEWTKKQ